MKYLYCDSCFLITLYENGKLGGLYEYKHLFYISKTQVEGELIKPKELSREVKRVVSIIEVDRLEIIAKTREFVDLYQTLSYYDCLCMAYSLVDGYCLVTNDKALLKKCAIHNIKTKTGEAIISEYGI